MRASCGPPAWLRIGPEVFRLRAEHRRDHRTNHGIFAAAVNDVAEKTFMKTVPPGEMCPVHHVRPTQKCDPVNGVTHDDGTVANWLQIVKVKSS